MLDATYWYVKNNEETVFPCSKQKFMVITVNAGIKQQGRHSKAL